MAVTASWVEGTSREASGVPANEVLFRFTVHDVAPVSRDAPTVEFPTLRPQKFDLVRKLGQPPIGYDGLESGWGSKADPTAERSHTSFAEVTHKDGAGEFVPLHWTDRTYYRFAGGIEKVEVTESKYYFGSAETVVARITTLTITEDATNYEGDYQDPGWDDDRVQPLAREAGGSLYGTDLPVVFALTPADVGATEGELHPNDPDGNDMDSSHVDKEELASFYPESNVSLASNMTWAGAYKTEPLEARIDTRYLDGSNGPKIRAAYMLLPRPYINFAYPEHLLLSPYACAPEEVHIHLIPSDPCPEITLVRADVSDLDSLTPTLTLEAWVHSPLADHTCGEVADIATITVNGKEFPLAVQHPALSALGIEKVYTPGRYRGVYAGTQKLHAGHNRVGLSVRNLVGNVSRYDFAVELTDTSAPGAPVSFTAKHVLIHRDVRREAYPYLLQVKHPRTPSGCAPVDTTTTTLRWRPMTGSAPVETWQATLTRFSFGLCQTAHFVAPLVALPEDRLPESLRGEAALAKGILPLREGCQLEQEYGTQADWTKSVRVEFRAQIRFVRLDQATGSYVPVAGFQGLEQVYVEYVADHAVAPGPPLVIMLDTLDRTFPVSLTYTSGSIFRSGPLQVIDGGLVPPASGEYVVGSGGADALAFGAPEPASVPPGDLERTEITYAGGEITSPQEAIAGTSPRVGFGGVISPHNGEVVLRLPLLSVPRVGFDWEFTLTYRSQVEYLTGPVGNSWDHGYNVRLERLEGGDLLLRDGDGRVDRYERREDEAGEVTYLSPPGHDAADRLVEVFDTAGWPARYGYTGRRLTSVTDPVGREIRLRYYEEGDPGGSPGDFRSVTIFVALGNEELNQEADYPSYLFEYHRPPAGGDPRLAHNLVAVYDPKGAEADVGGAFSVKKRMGAAAFMAFVYGLAGADKVESQTFGESGRSVYALAYGTDAGKARTTGTTKFPGFPLRLSSCPADKRIGRHAVATAPIRGGRGGDGFF